ncbi:hypothetical protein OSB04_023714 [Centaurea solstitialis]|uniref:Uncharacterized protein n=1 Tax=Centaurea solstitialis TaxID=347529 RepID=A0AA38W2J0_9ASTR|nr:hypothetical protein OSB04_023714 [Centaurea solstitialis]
MVSKDGCARAIEGSLESSFAKFLVYCHNPRSTTKITFDEVVRFDMLFVALGCLANLIFFLVLVHTCDFNRLHICFRHGWEQPDRTYAMGVGKIENLAIRMVFPSSHHELCFHHFVVILHLTLKRDKAKKWMFWEHVNRIECPTFRLLRISRIIVYQMRLHILREVGYER